MSKDYKDFIKEYGLGYNALYVKPMAALNPLRKKENVKKVKENGSKKSKGKKLEISTLLTKWQFG